MPDFLKVNICTNEYIFTGLTIAQLKECWIACEMQKHYCHPESVFQPLIDQDMRTIKEEIIKLRRQHSSQ